MNRKLIRTTLAEVKGRGDTPTPKERSSIGSGGGDSSGGRTTSGGGSGGGGSHRGTSSGGGSGGHQSSGGSSQSSSAAAQGRKRMPSAETNAEIFYYKKQMDAHTLMVIVLLDGEEVEGTIEWYDRSALKINRKSLPNIMLLKHNIKYMYKAEDREGDSAGS